MPLVRLTKNPSGRQLLVFAAAWLVFFGAIALSFWRHGRLPVAAAAAGVAVGVPLVGAAYRPVLRLAYLGLSYATYPVGVVVSYVVLALVYFVALTPIGWIMRLFGHDPLGRRFEPARATYWVTREPARLVDSYFKQD